jgi:ASC-1-like (ASCH) protein
VGGGVQQMKMIHALKLNTNFAEPILSGRKTFEIRKNDRGFQTGDIIMFQAVDDFGKYVPHEINNISFEITYVLNGWGIENNYVVLSIKRVRKRRRRVK